MPITPEQFDYVQRLFLRLRPMSEEDRMLEVADEPEILRHEVLSLLAANDSCGTFLQIDEQVNSDSGNDATIELHTSPSLSMPKYVGRYRILQQLGEGGHGAVFMAEQNTPIHRKVAVKLIKPGMDSKQVLARFHAERQALTMMDHPSIARVIDAGASETGAPYFVMELVKGLPIQEFCDQNSLNLDQRLEVFLQVCEAVHHAHQKGIIHRDLKPSNVLVAMAESEPIAKVIDFGIAKALDTRLTQQTLFTEYGQMIGTLEYMSPEQAEMSSVDIDTRSDVYSLGVLLYQLLTGKTPISKAELLRNGIADIPRLIRETEPATPSNRITALRQHATRTADVSPQRGLANLKRTDLDWITMKALAGDRRRRYDSALDFARDIKRFMRAEPVVAHPPSFTYKLSKCVKRYRLTAASGLVVFASLLMGIIGLAVGLRQAGSALAQATSDRNAATAAQTEAERSSRRLAENMYSELLESAWEASKEHDNDRAIQLLDSCLPELRGWEWEFARNQIQERPHSVLRLTGQAAIAGIDFNSMSNRSACALEDGNVEVWNLRHDKLLHTIMIASHANVARFNSDASQMVIGTSQGELLTYRSGDWEPTSSTKLDLGGVYDVCFSDSGKQIAVCTGGSWVVVINLESLQIVSKWQLPSRASRIAFIEEKDQLIALGLDGYAYSIQTGNGNVTKGFVSRASLHGMTWIDNATIAALSSGATLSIDVFDLNSPPNEITRRQGIASAIATNPAGLIVVGGADGSLILKDPDNDSQIAANFGSAITAIGATNSASEFLVGLSDGRLLRVDVNSSQKTPSARERAPLSTEVLLANRELSIAFDSKGSIRVFDLTTGELQLERAGHSMPVWAASHDDQESLLATVGDDQFLRCWELPDMKLRFEQPIAWGVRDVCVAPDGSWIATAPQASKAYGGQEGTIALWDTQTGQPTKVLKGHDNWVLKLASTRDGARLVSACENRETRVWNIANASTEFVVSPSKKSPAEFIGFSNDETTLYLGHRDGWVTSWNMMDGSPQAVWPAFGDALSGLAVSNDNRVLATSRSSAYLRIHDFTKQKTLAGFDLGVGYISNLQLSNDQRFLSFTGKNQRIRSTPTGRQRSR